MGSKTLLETDHKPLVPLLSTKNLELPILIHRFWLQMMRYSYEIHHVPGKELNTANYLSRSPLPTTDAMETEFHLLTLTYNRSQIERNPNSSGSRWKAPDSEIWNPSAEEKGKSCYGLVNPQWTVNEQKPSCNTKETPEGGIRPTGHQNSVWWPEITTDILNLVVQVANTKDRCFRWCDLWNSQTNAIFNSGRLLFKIHRNRLIFNNHFLTRN